ADAVDGATRRRDLVEERRPVRRHGVVAAVRRAPESAGAADERPGDHPADIVGIGELAREAAERVEAVEAEGGLVRRDLQDAVGGGVEHGLAGLEMLRPELLDDLRARGAAVAEDAGQAAALD